MPDPAYATALAAAFVAGGIDAMVGGGGLIQLPAGVAAFAASLAGAMTVSRASRALFRPLVPVLLTLVLLYTLAHRGLGREHAPRQLDRAARLRGTAAVGAIGFYDGFFGPGTGSLLMLLFIRHYGFDFVNAAAAARLLNVATNPVALVWFAWHGQILWPLGLAMAVANVAGAQLGTRIALRRGAGFVRGAFVLVVAALIAKTGWDALPMLGRR